MGGGGGGGGGAASPRAGKSCLSFLGVGLLAVLAMRRRARAYHVDGWGYESGLKRLTPPTRFARLHFYQPLDPGLWCQLYPMKRGRRRYMQVSAVRIDGPGCDGDG